LELASVGPALFFAADWQGYYPDPGLLHYDDAAFRQRFLNCRKVGEQESRLAFGATFGSHP
jgi:hypothetical protein